MPSKRKEIHSMLIVLCAISITLVQTQNCKMEDFDVQSNFDEKKFEGKWYELSWIIVPWVKPEWNYLDYFHTYNQTDYGYSYFGEGRDPDSKECITPQPGTIYRTGKNAKFLKTHRLPSGQGVENASYWIIDTDYVNYALVFGCREEAPNGTCIAPDGWMWSRCPKPPMEYVEKMEAWLPKLCLSKDMFLITKQKNECGREVGTCGSGVKMNPFWTILSTMLFLSLIIGF